MSSSYFTTLSEIVEPKHTAVVVVDIQNDFFAKDGHFARTRNVNVSMVPAFLSRTSAFLDACRRFGIRMIFIQSLQVYGTDKISGPQQERWHRLGVQEQYIVPGSWGADFCSPTGPQPGETIVPKYRYSAFTNPEFDALLKANKVATLVLVGGATNVCLECTAAQAYMSDYYVVIVKDCVMALSQEEHEAGLRDLNTYFGIAVSSDELLNVWQEKISV